MNHEQYFEKESVKYAGFWIRVVARIIDVAIFWLIWIIGVLIYFSLSNYSSPTNLSFVPLYYPFFYNAYIPVGLFIFSILFFIAYFLYFVLMDVRSGATLGKIATGLTIRKEEDLTNVGFGKAVGRFFAKEFISFPVIWLGVIWVAWDKQKQSWHDKLARTVVVYQSSLIWVDPPPKPLLKNLPMIGNKFGELIFVSGLMKKNQFSLRGDHIKLGRKSELVHITIKDPEKTVSRIQCEIFSKNDRYYIRNLSDGGTTKLNGKKLQSELPLRSNDIISFGSHSAKIVIF